MIRQIIKPALLICVLLTIITGIVYPLVVTGLAQVVFSAKANGSLIFHDGKAVGSELIGQPFDDPKYFWSRPSATMPVAYNAASSSGSNLGPTNPALVEAIHTRMAALSAVDPDNKLPVPVDLVTASASGLDPHISPAAAEYQVHRVAKARGLDENTVRKLIVRQTKDRTFGLLGEPRVNVVQLNLDLDNVQH